MTEQGSPVSHEEPPTSDDEEASSRSRWIVVTSALVVLAVLALMVVLASRFGSDVGYVASAVIDQEMPSLVLERLGEDGTLAFDDLRGDIVVVNFWASWCTSCRKEHPDLIRTAAAYEPWGVRFVGVSFQDEESAAIAMLDDLGWGYDYVVDSDSRAAIAFGVRGVPETYFVDRSGVIRARIYGAATEASLSTQLDALLLEVPPGQGD